VLSFLLVSIFIFDVSVPLAAGVSIGAFIFEESFMAVLSELLVLLVELQPIATEPTNAATIARLKTCFFIREIILVIIVNYNALTVKVVDCLVVRGKNEYKVTADFLHVCAILSSKTYPATWILANFSDI
jgi:hypothetical protein